MAWKFDSQIIDLTWIETIDSITYQDNVTLDLGTGDLNIDTGTRDNSTSILDQGLRVIDGSI